MDSLNGTWEAGSAEPVAGNDALSRKIFDITVLYPGDSGATTDEAPVMGVEEQALVSYSMETTHTKILRVLVRQRKTILTGGG